MNKTKTVLGAFVMLCLLISGCQSKEFKMLNLSMDKIIESVVSETTVSYHRSNEQSKEYSGDVLQLKDLLQNIDFKTTNQQIEENNNIDLSLNIQNYEQKINSLTFYLKDDVVLVGTNSFQTKKGSNKVYVPTGVEYTYEITNEQYNSLLELLD